MQNHMNKLLVLVSFFLLVERTIIMLTLNQTAVNYSLFLFFFEKKVGALNEDHIRLNIKL